MGLHLLCGRWRQGWLSTLLMVMTLVVSGTEAAAQRTGARPGATDPLAKPSRRTLRVVERDAGR